MKSRDMAPARVTAGEISRNFGQWQDVALSGPVIVTHHGRPRVVMISAEHYAAAGLAEGPAGFDNDSALQTAETARSAILGHMNEAFVALDPDLRIIAVNAVFEDLKGASAAQLVGLAWTEVFSAPVQALIGEQFRRVLRTGETLEFESESTVQSGRCFGVRVFPYPGGVAAVFVNRTEERDLRARLDRAAALETALSVLPGVATARLNIRGVLASMDADFLRLTGFSEAELRDCRLSDIVRPAERRSLTQAVEHALQGDAPARLPVTLLVKDGAERTVELALATVRRDGVPEGVLAVLST
ncbi:prevent-host-death family protein [Caulobacter flavus]|uniref:Prevent-host-death family protein n=1 Tax=Caulobacter flavus TaxID=1679497 RepID=A0A2N5CNI8_9CAUL|nr:PAS domain-containing protein [Caulobacter flavus]AYV49349.1 prevent-host-death family protein [Caulobacter flavus]PLR08074.1 prevent-host-death family protein [Caulobacter flavus]